MRSPTSQDRMGRRRWPPTPWQDLLGEPVELADMPEGEGAQEGAQDGGGHDPVAQPWLVAPQRSRAASSMQ